ncbi:hypothetical protein F5882DRAFT_32599 [Hyaloscypha sp. PMI_1271]|nr:hypothetical protein F5882DRAFT_32599 [Hyaloscypha sp. PMI_1271]
MSGKQQSIDMAWLERGKHGESWREYRTEEVQETTTCPVSRLPSPVWRHLARSSMQTPACMAGHAPSSWKFHGPCAEFLNLECCGDPQIGTGSDSFPQPPAPIPQTQTQSPCIPALDVAMPLARYDRRSLCSLSLHAGLISPSPLKKPQWYLSFKPGSVNDLRRGLRRGTIVCVSDWRMVRWQLHGLHGGSACPYLVHAVCLSLRK